jgi:hypothetical protein
LISKQVDPRSARHICQKLQRYNRQPQPKGRLIRQEDLVAVSTYLEIVVKVFTILSFSGLAFGGALIWRYLAIMEISGEIIPALSSPQALMALAVWATIISALIVLMMFVAPVLYKQTLNLFIRESTLGRGKLIAVHGIAFAAPPCIFLALSAADFPITALNWTYGALVDY